MKRTLAAAALSAVSALFVAAAGAPAQAAEGGLKAGDHVAVIGDSITEQKQYSVFIEDYLLMCKPVGGITVTQFGWGGETAPGFAGRMANDMIPFAASAATTNFGMNDGGYSPMDDAKAKRYHDGQTSVVQQLKRGGVRFIVVGSPGCVDADTFRRDPQAATMYNKTLTAERDIAKKVAEEQGVVFADVIDPMLDVMQKAKAKYGAQYHVAGGDGVHPEANGHLVMAYAYLKGLGCDGNIGTITLDLAGNKAEATDGHKVLGFHDGAVEIESSRYPFCFYGDPKTTNATTGVIEFLPFNEELNRFRLVVPGAKPAAKYKVTWGAESKTFDGDALAKGINLAAEFLQNPFSEPFRKVEEKIREQQNFETPLVKQLIHDLPQYERVLPEEKEIFGKLRPELVSKDKPLREESAAAVTPVKHTIKVEEVK
ncbi:MAG: LysophospholiPASe [Phycisphaerales bacterium]|nr:LysophospholiPASe [Phycisphaerales bacterium]